MAASIDQALLRECAASGQMDAGQLFAHYSAGELQPVMFLEDEHGLVQGELERRHQSATALIQDGYAIDDDAIATPDDLVLACRRTAYFVAAVCAAALAAAFSPLFWK
jgi:hypothetical protein